MNTEATDRRQRDRLTDWRFNLLAYCIPIAAIVATGTPVVGTGWRTAVWAASSAVMGAACLMNAMRCGRMHCYFTGPFFLLIAALVLLYGTGLLPLGPNGWNILGLALLAGGLGLTYGPELIWGRYRHGTPADRG